MQLLSKLGYGGAVDSYFALVLSIFRGGICGLRHLSCIRLRSEESQKYSEMLLTNSVSRNQWAVSNLIFAIFGPALVMIIFSLALGLTYGTGSGNLSIDLPRILLASLAYLPAVWMLTGITMLLFGLIPRLTALSWLALGLFVVIDLLGEFFNFDQWILNLSPFTHVPIYLLAIHLALLYYGFLF